ncbi:MAG: hypothetical protein KDB40_18260 [Acidimicrobiales bacterium]|nr:hypothetical protein [Acidimicrobiales bacterium]MCB9394074.1 ABC transporter permease [Acidimicrobiaceae bacterium]
MTTVTTIAPPPASSTTRARGSWHGTGRLFRLALRLDRTRIVMWTIGTAALVGVSATSIDGLYTTDAERLAYAQITRDNAAMIIQAGPGYGLDRPTNGAILMNEVAVWTFVLVAILGIMATARATRLDEETARAELVRSAPVGRHAGAAAGVLSVLVTLLVVGIAVAFACVGAGFGVVGAVAFGISLVGVGMVFAAITAVAAQVASTTRGTRGLALSVLGAAFVVRAVGDVSAPWFSWLSPIHWGQAVRAYADERWAAPVVSAAVALGGLAVALRWADHRDFGAGLLPPRPARATASRWLTSPIALAARLHRGPTIGWVVGVAVLGAFYGVVADQAEEMLADNPELADFLAGLGGASITDAFLATGLLVVGLLAAGCGVSAALRMRAEESAGRADPLLAAPVSRTTWAGGHQLVVLAAVVTVTVAGAFAQGLGAAVSMGDARQVGRVTVAGLVMAPAPAVLTGFAFALAGAAPRRAALAWAALVLAASMGLLAEVLGLPGWARDLSPFQHVPAMPAAPFRLAPVLGLIVVAAACCLAGLAGVRRRDLAVG